MMSVKSKNIHVLPTEKPSRLYLTTKEYIFEKEYSLSTDECQNKHIYITSPNEDIDENDYIITKDGKLVQVSYLLSKDLEGASKIILTTDQDLIKDGVQAIDDEFLEWFVKNPSCEEVEVERDSREVGGHNGGSVIEYGLYEIIIPKEEPKQETLEEAADRYFPFAEKIGGETYTAYRGFMAGAKWQQEQIYNHIKELYDNENITGFSKRAYVQCLDIIEQFKNK